MLRPSALTITSGCHAHLVIDDLRRHLEGLRSAVASVDPRRLPGDACVELLEVAADVERMGAALKVLVADRAVTAADWRQAGHRSAGSWLAATAASTVGDALATLDTSRRLEHLDATVDAVRAGRLSAAQVRAVAAAAAADPVSEVELIEAAGYLSVKGLQDRARMVEAAAALDTPERREAMHRSRFLRWTSTADGMFRISGAFTAEAGSELFSAVRSRASYSADEAYRAGLPEESQAAYDADALVALAVGDDRRAGFGGVLGGRSRSATVVMHVSLDALRRGQLEPGEKCEIPGVGPVPLAAVENLMGDSFAHLVVSDGVDVTTVCSVGRTVPGHVRTALEARDPVCVVPGCHVNLSLEIDHWQVPYARGGPSELWNLARVCRLHHRMKTYDGFELRGGPGEWEWVPPLRA